MIGQQKFGARIDFLAKTKFQIIEPFHVLQWLDATGEVDAPFS
jgi:hypothetical protein